MQRATGLAALRRAATAARLSQSHRLCQSLPFNFSSYQSPPPSSSSSSFSSVLFQWLPRRFAHHLRSAPTHGSLSSVGTMFYSVAAASSVGEDVPATKPSQSHKFKDVVLYQYEACLFCNKVKAFLDYYDIPYKVVEVNPISKKEIKWSDYKKVPILTADGQQMVNSSDIIDDLFKRMHPEIRTNSMTNTEEEKKWLRWVDDHLVHVLSPNIYRTVGEALESFNYITTHGNFSFVERAVAKYTGAAAMYFVAKKLKKKHEITDERAALYQAAETWVDALQGRNFLGGSKPNLADLAVFGVLRPIRRLQSGKDMVQHTRIGDWYSVMEKAVGQSSKVTT